MVMSGPSDVVFMDEFNKKRNKFNNKNKICI
jgi:hypothetical protein